jgi:hypothetical protein
MAPQLPTQLINLIMRSHVEEDNDFTIRFRVLFNGEDKTTIIALLSAATRLLCGWQDYFTPYSTVIAQIIQHDFGMFKPVRKLWQNACTHTIACS